MSGILMTKSEDFAVRIIGLYNYLVHERSQYAMEKQILESGTSIGANPAEAQEAFSKAELLKMLTAVTKTTRRNIIDRNATE